MNTISRVPMLMAMLVLSTPKTSNPITTSRATTMSAQGEPIHFESTDAIEANIFESCWFICISSLRARLAACGALCVNQIPAERSKTGDSHLQPLPMEPASNTPFAMVGSW
jgi:hypothetical protein